MRCFSRRAVSGFVVHIGVSTFRTSAGLDRVHRPIADGRKDIRLERGEPLRFVLGVLERGAVRGVHLLRRLLECRHGAPLAAPLGERIATRARLAPEPRRLLARIGERYELHAAEPEVGSLAGDDAAPDPPLRAGRIDEQIQPVAVRVAAGLRVADAHRGQALVRVPPARFSDP